MTAKVKRLVVDLETNGLLQEVTKIHCIAVCDIDSSYSELYVGTARVQEFIDKMKNDTSVVLIGHNLFCYDLKVIEKLYGVDFTKTHKIQDTLILGQLLFSDIKNDDFNHTHGLPGKVFSKRDYGSHSLKAWGQRICCFKGEYTGTWEEYNDDMGRYCIQDTYTTKSLFQILESRIANKLLNNNAIELEYSIAPILARLQAHGVLFDRDKADNLISTLTAALVEANWKLQEIFKPRFVSGGSFIPKRSDKNKGYVAGREFTKITLEEFNPGSRTQIVDRLIKEYGWNPEEFTEKGNAKMDEDIIENLPFKELAPLKTYLTIKKRISQIETGRQAWINKVDKDGRIRGAIRQNGAVTGRATHFSPNLSQVPANETLYGKECRELFIAGEDKVLVGVDADALEMRCLAGYLTPFDSGRFTSSLLEGKKEDGTDPHTLNMLAYGVEDRDCAKTLFYACVTMDTTVLTKTGWKLYEDVCVGELVLTYNAKTNSKEFKPILEKVYYPSAPVIEMSHSHNFKFKSTPNHRWFVRQRRVTGARARYWDEQIRETKDINTESNIIVNAPYTQHEEGIFYTQFKEPKFTTDWTQRVLNMDRSERKAFLLGFLLADGHKKGEQWIWCQNKNNIAEAVITASYLETSGYLYISGKNGYNEKMYNVILGKKQHITGQKLRKVICPEQPVWCIRTENESFVARQGNTITITGNTLYGAKNAKIGATLMEYGVDFEQYVAEYEKDVKGMMAWINKKNEEDREKGKEPMERTEAYWRCWIAGKECNKRYGEKIPELGLLNQKISETIDRKGYIKGLDGRKLFCRTKHGALNTVLQSAGAIIMKKALYIADTNLQKEGLVPGKDYEFVLWIHDEYQLEVTNDQIIVDKVRRIVENSIKEAGEFFGFPTPMKGNSEVGANWSETH